MIDVHISNFRTVRRSTFSALIAAVIAFQCNDKSSAYFNGDFLTAFHPAMSMTPCAKLVALSGADVR